MPLHPRTCSILYSISCLLDALDGYAARAFEQSTRFGAVLDMVTDRCTTACLLVFLSSAWPRWSLLFQGLISLDLASHYVHMYATLIMGGSDTSHKKVDKSRSWILNLYYTNKVSRHPLDRSLQDKLTNLISDCPLPFLRFERNILHRPLPPFFLLAPPFAISPPS
ncbi:phosphatidylinositol synthase 1 (CDP-alcohol phosphatidyltransferase1) [Clarireedia jacksonii]